MSKKISLLFILISTIIVFAFALKQNSPTQTTQTHQDAPLKHQSWQLFTSTNWHIEKTPGLTNHPTQSTLMFSDKLAYQNNQSVSHMVNPLIVQQQGNQIYLVQSNQAKTIENSQIELNGGVMIKTLKMNDNTDNNTLLSEQLFYNTQDETITSDAKVKLIRQDMVIEGTGLTANINTGRYEFFSNVTTLYQPAKRAEQPLSQD